MKWRGNTRDIRFMVFLLWFDIIWPNCDSHMSILHFVELSPDPWPTNKRKKGKKDEKSDWKIFATCTRCVNAISSFPPLWVEESWKIDFTADGIGGKAAVASFPPLRAEENWKIHFTANDSGGKAAIASFPLIVEENWKKRVYRPCKQR